MSRMDLVIREIFHRLKIPRWTDKVRELAEG